MPRRQRFKPSRKPKPLPMTNDSDQAPPPEVEAREPLDTAAPESGK